ncbi:MAG: DNA repair protein RecO [Bacilli bacterium]|nr:DNA repair protein RecO [Bacilli bacterium]
MNKKVEGIIIREKDYSDTSKILDVFTKEYGIIGVISKGCKQMKNPLRSVSSKFTYGIFNIYYKENKLSTLKEVDIINSFKNIKISIETIAYATFLLDLAEQVYKQNNNEEIYYLLINTLIKINDKFDPLVLTNIMELKYLEYLGVMPELNRCSVCGSTNIVTLSSDKGGYICSNCRTFEPILDSKTIKLIRMFYYVDISKIEKLSISDNIKQEINTFLDSYYERYTGLYLKSKQFLNNLKNIS